MGCPEAELSILLVNNPRMRAINREFRELSKTTDVLSFPMFDELPPPEMLAGQPLLLGDVVLCLERIRSQARARDWSFDDELCFCLVHGILHLVGFDHEEDPDQAAEMFDRQRELFLQLRPETRYSDYINL